MKLAGIVGWPVDHSLSPLLHGLWIAEHRLDAAYVPLPVRREDFAPALEGLRMAGFVGLNVTLPHKEAAFAIADVCDAASHGAGAANLLLFGESGIEARNTDVEGLALNLEADAKRSLAGVRAVVIGAGGAARAAVLACDRLQARAITVLNRTPKRAELLAGELANRIKSPVSAASLEEWPRIAPATRLLVHSTSAGMNGAPSLALALDALPADAVVCDLVYDPLETPLLARARARGLVSVDGLGMLIHQAIPSFEALFGIRPNATPATRRRLEAALGK